MTPVCRAATLSLAASCWLASLTFAQDTAAVPPGASAAPAPLMTPIVQSGLDVDGTAFHYQPSAFVSELCDPLAPICCEPPRFWVGAEYLLWTIRPGPLPVPVATTSTLIPPPVTGAVGRLGEPGTVVVLGNQDLNYGTFSGLRMNVGYLISPSAGISLEGSGFFLERRTDDNFAVTDDQGNNLLAIPVVNVLSGNEGRAIYGFPGEFIGGIGISSGSRLWSAETNAALLGIAERGAWRFDLLAGFRYADLNENVGIGASTFIIGQGFLSTYRDIQLFPGDTIITQDNFRARNQFYGGQIGLRAETTFRRFFLQGVAKIALGYRGYGLPIGRPPPAARNRRPDDRSRERRRSPGPGRRLRLAHQHRLLFPLPVQRPARSRRHPRLATQRGRPRRGRLHLPLLDQRCAAR
ncbi:MAG TPA: BBP7 family outer membrane beta-barrel protein [Gemmatales bacterium]|nr:BBP7 family outer membrane beta-barrel protein [Gemmatales bacterium]